MRERPWPRIGWRNIGRNPRRTVLTALGLAVGFFAVVFMIGWSRGIMAELVENATSLVSGQIEIHHAEYRPDRSMYDTLGGREGVDVEAMLRTIDADEAVTAAAPRVYAGGLVSSGEATSAGMFMGVDPEREVALTRFLDELAAGRLPEPGRNELLIGEEMARQIAADVGDELVLVGSAADGSMANDLYTVAGVFRTGLVEFDARTAVLAIGDLQALIYLDPDRIHEIAAAAADPTAADAVADRTVRVGTAATVSNIHDYFRAADSATLGYTATVTLPNSGAARGTAAAIVGRDTDRNGNDDAWDVVVTAGSTPGTATVTVTARDRNSSASWSFGVTVPTPPPPANKAPTAYAGQDIVVNAGEQATLAGQGSDPDGDDLSYAWQQVLGPTVTLRGANASTAFFTAPSDFDGASVELVFRLCVDDGEANPVCDSVAVTVHALPTVGAGADRTVDGGVPVTLTATGEDPAGETLEYRWEQVSGSAQAWSDGDAGRYAAGAAARLTATANLAEDTALVFRVTASASGRAVSAETTATVRAAPPMVDAGADQVVDGGATVTLAATGEDPAGETLVYRWEQVSGPTVALFDADGESYAVGATALFTAPELGEDTVLIFRIVAAASHREAEDAVEIAVRTVVRTHWRGWRLGLLLDQPQVSTPQAAAPDG